jgi:hypothetical protein
MLETILVLVCCAIFASVVREYYGNKGFFVMPKVTEKGLALGSLTAILTAIFAVLVNFAVLSTAITLPLAVSLGISWGLASPDIVANIIEKVNQKS